MLLSFVNILWMLALFRLAYRKQQRTRKLLFVYFIFNPILEKKHYLMIFVTERSNILHVGSHTTFICIPNQFTTWQYFSYFQNVYYSSQRAFFVFFFVIFFIFVRFHLYTTEEQKIYNCFLSGHDRLEEKEQEHKVVKSQVGNG